MEKSLAQQLTAALDSVEYHISTQDRNELIDLIKQVEALEAASAKQQAALTVAISDLTLISKQKTVERKAEGFFTREIHKPTAAAIVAIQTLEAIDEALK